MKSVPFLSVALALVAGQATALSCVQPDVARSYEFAAQAEERYLIILGTLAFGEVPSSDTGEIHNPREVEVEAQFLGQYLTQDGFQAAPPLAVDIEFTCAASWCGSMTSDDAPVLAFVEQSDAGYTLTVGPCGGQAFKNPSDAQIDQVLSCMRGESCEPVAHR